MQGPYSVDDLVTHGGKKYKIGAISKTRGTDYWTAILTKAAGRAMYCGLYNDRGEILGKITKIG